MSTRPCAFITGGAGFIGFHAARHFLDKRWNVVVLDNLARSGVGVNLNELKSHSNLTFVRGDVRKPKDIAKALSCVKGRADLVIHLAAQVAVTDSVINPRHDLEVNLLGTFNLLEAVRNFSKTKRPRLFIFTSTNKVYGNLASVPTIPDATRYKLSNANEAIAETQQLDFHSPYGCSKGAADQYVKDYCSIYGIPTVVLRNSCIYGSHQYGIEDQGWVAHFGIRAYLNRPINIYGDGKQVRDILYVEDLIRLMDILYKNPKVCRGKVYNVGGGKHQALSLLELAGILESRLKKKISLRFSAWRPGDQKIYVSDIGQLKNDFGWHPKVSIETGLDRMLSWIETHLDRIEKISLGKKPAVSGNG